MLPQLPVYTKFNVKPTLLVKPFPKNTPSDTFQTKQRLVTIVDKDKVSATQFIAKSSI